MEQNATNKAADNRENKAADNRDAKDNDLPEIRLLQLFFGS